MLGGSSKSREYAGTTAWAKGYFVSDLAEALQETLEEDLRQALLRLVVVREDVASAAGSGVPSQPGPPGSNLEVVDKVRAYRNVIVEGVAGTGKSFLLERLRDEFGAENVAVVVFHPATAYEDFVEGLRPEGLAFIPRDGAFLQICRRAAAAGESAREFVLVIDEVNRANTAKVLGDLLYSMEPSKRVPVEAADAVLSAGADDPDVDVPWVTLQLQRTDDEGREFRQRLCVPQNLYIVGTMNTTDRSVGTIDLALRRRFVFERMEPLTAERLRVMISRPDLNADIDTWATLNQRLAAEVGPDAVLGHSYFFDYRSASERAPAGTLNIWRDLLLPQLAEVVVSFNALDKITELTEGLTMGGHSLVVVGAGLDAFPMVRDS